MCQLSLFQNDRSRFCQHYESLDSAKAGFGLDLQQELMRPATCHARTSGVARDIEVFDYCTRDRLHLSHSARRSMPPLILFAELLTPAVVSVNNRSCYISYFAAFCPSRGSTWPCSNGQLKLGSFGDEDPVSPVNPVREKCAVLCRRPASRSQQGRQVRMLSRR